MTIYFLTCKDKTEARKIAKALLENKLIACCRMSSIESLYWWDEQINQDNEILLMMESIPGKFEDIQKVVADNHSYEQFVLSEVKVRRTSEGVLEWLHQTVR